MSEMATGEPTGEAPEQGAPPEGQQQQQGTVEAPNPVLERMNEMQQGFERRLDEMSQRLPEQQQQQAEPEFDPVALMYPELAGTPEGEEAEREARDNAAREDAQRINALAEAVADRKVAERMAPIEERLFHQDLSAFTEKYPVMADPEKAAPYITKARAYLGRENVDLVTLEMVYLAEQARERIGQPAADGSEVPLEQGGGGVAPGAEEDVAARILGASGKSGAIRDFL